MSSARRLPSSRDYATAAGLVIAAFQRLPETGEACDIAGWRFEVVDLDGRRIDKLLATRPGAGRAQLALQLRFERGSDSVRRHDRASKVTPRRVRSRRRCGLWSRIAPREGEEGACGPVRP
ncbi:transporter associated domain-containing protein [Methylobacterium oryzae CBMB20]